MYNPIFQEHQTGDHPENGGRTRAALQRLQKVGLDKQCIRPSWAPASNSRLAYVHACEYLDRSKSMPNRAAVAGHGATLNLPIDFGTPRETQLTTFADKLDAFAKQLHPELFLVSAGFDSHKDEPIGSLGLESEEFRTRIRNLLDVAAEYTDGRLIRVLEGGYNPAALAESIEFHLDEMMK